MKIIDLINGPWAIRPEMLDEIHEIYSRHLRGEKLNQKAMIEAIGSPPKPNERRYLSILENGVAVVSMQGVMAKKMNLFSNISGGTSTQMIGNEFKEALDDPAVKSIMLDIDSPGGAVDGTADLGRIIKEARGVKPIMAFTDGEIGSAAYWAASAADKIFISNETNMVGSIGVIAKHLDHSKRLEAAGIKETEITSGTYKSPAPASQPLSDFGRGVIQGLTDQLYSSFVDTVAANRGLDASNHEAWADGRIFMGQGAVDAGLVDGIMSREQLIDNMAAGDAAVDGSMALNAGDAIQIQGHGSGVVVNALEIEAPAAGGAEEKPKSEENMTLETLKASHPEVFKAAYQEGVDSVDLKAVKAEAIAEGAAAEVARVADVKAQAIPGHDALVAEMVADGKTTGPEAAQRILAAQRIVLTDKAAAISADATDLIAASEPAKALDDLAGLTAEEKLEKTWAAMDADAQGAAGGKETFMAYEKNKGRAKVLGG